MINEKNNSRGNKNNKKPKRNGETFQENVEKFRTLFETMVQGVVYQSVDGTILAANPAAEKILGLSLDQMTGRTSMDPRWRSIHEDGTEFPGEKHPAIEAARTGKEVRNVIMGVFNPAKDGYKWIEINSTPQFKTGQNIPYQIITTFEDITERKYAEEALMESESKFRTMFETLKEGMALHELVCDDSGNAINYRIVEINPAYEKQTGISAVQAKGRLATELYGTPEAPYLDKYERVATSGEPDSFETYFEPLKRHYEISAYSPKPGWFVTIFSDITERKRMENSLRASEEMLDSIMNGVSVLITYIDCDERYVFVNKAYAAWYGFSRKDLLGKRVSDVLSPDVYQRVSQYTKKALSGKRVSYENKAIDKDGNERFVTVNYEPHFHQGKVNGFFSSIIDITERKHAEEALLKSEELFRTVIEHSYDAITMISPDGTILYDSPSVLRILGFTMKERIGRKVFEFVHPEERHDMELGFAKFALQPGKTMHYCGRFLHKNGTPRWVEGIRSNLINEPMVQAIVVNYRDITESKLAGELSEKLQEQLRQSQKMESVGRLAGGVAHDFNNILTVIMSNAEIALMSLAPDDPVTEEINEIKEASERAADLTSKLLAFARKQTVNPKILDLNDTVTGMLKILGRLIGENIELIWKPGPGLWNIKMDPTQVDQILANLSVNARDAIKGVGSLTIETENIVFDETYANSHSGYVPGEYVLLAVSDTGEGMDKETVERLFEPFFTTKEVGKGTGLGLATVYGAVRQNNGFINVYSEPGRGTTFKIYLPRTSEFEVEPLTAIRKPSRGTETIIIAEDEESILQIGKTVLLSLGYEVLAAHTPGEAIALAKSHKGPIHLLITDVVMPEMNGKELRDKIAVFWPKIKTLFMSGYTANVIAHHGVIDQGIQFLQKPFSINTLAVKVREALDT